jgi:DNA (cytosine-5)-methyltransferase 1
MQVISLFSGIGGGELAATWAGWDIVVSCEINPFGRKILSYYWPEAYHHDDIHTLNYETIIKKSRWDSSKPTIVIGGWPCQPFSMAGKRKGTEDDRHLWPEFARIIREIKPEYICGENVPGFVNWSDGLVFEQSITDLETKAYEVWPVILPACGVNAPHKRDRVWFVAHATSQGREERIESGGRSDSEEAGAGLDNRPERPSSIGNVTDPNGDQRCEGGMHKTRPETTERHAGSCDSRNFGRTNWDNFPTQPPVCGRNDGIPRKLDGITFSKWRNESIKGFGNAWVPQVALQIFNAINEFNKL